MSKFTLSKTLGLDRAVLFSIGGRIWLVLAGVLNIYFISKNTNNIEQGYFYTFQSLLAFQILFDLSLGSILSQFAAHEMASLNWRDDGTVGGNETAKSRLASILRIYCKWYLIAATLMTVILSFGGWIYFLKTAPPQELLNISWGAPWIAVCITTSFLLVFTPLLGIIEGCGKIEEVVKFRFIQDVLSYLIFWLVLSKGFGLYSLSIFFISKIVLHLLYFILVRRLFILDLISKTIKNEINFLTEIFPIQSRTMVAALSTLIGYSMIVPIVFSSQGPIVAGQLGMTLSITSALATTSYVWINTKVPIFCNLVATRSYSELNVLFYRVRSHAFIFLICIAIFFIFFIILINYLDLKYAERFADPVSTVFLVLAAVLSFPNYCYSALIRAHKREVTAQANLVVSSLLLISIWFLAKSGSLIFISIPVLIGSSLLSFWVYRLYIIHIKIWQK